MRRRFEEGYGVYACRSCGRKTRNTDGGVRLCAECDEFSMIENGLSDGNYGDEGSPDYLDAEHRIEELKRIAISKGGKFKAATE